MSVWNIRHRAALVGAALTLGTAADASTVAEFLAKAERLKAKGMMALFSPDLGAMKAEFMSAGKAWHAQVAPPGGRRNACPPAGPLKTSSDDILAMLNAVPVEKRASTNTTDAIIAGLNRRYPCKG